MIRSMKNILILFLVFTNLAIAEDFFPTQESSKSIEITDPNIDPNSKHSFIKQDVNYTKSDLNVTIIDNLTTKLGNLKYSKDVNISNQENMKGYSDALNKKTPSNGNTISNLLMNNIGNYDTSDVKSMSNKNIKKKDSNSTQSQVIDFMKGFNAYVSTKIGNIKTIDCFITRKLVNSYFCPLPSLNNSFFKGGKYRDSKAKAKDACNELCQEKSVCLSKKMPKNKKVSYAYPKVELKQGVNHEVAIDTSMKVSFITLKLSSTYKYDSNVVVGAKDYNASMAIKELNSSSHGINFDVSYWDDDEGKFKQYFSLVDMQIKDINSEMKLYLSNLKTSKIKVSFFDKYSFFKDYKIEDNKLKVYLDEIDVEYVDNNWWFCPATQFVNSVAACEGETKIVDIGGVFRKVCVTEEGQFREQEYGAYYTQNECASVCYVKAECLPTYRHLTSFNPLTLPEDLKDVEIGCIDTPLNSSCTSSACRELFLKDKMPIVEKTWVSTDKLKLTVTNGVQVNGVARPRIDVEAELSSNGNKLQKKLTGLGEMSEISYMNMVEADTYDVSLNTVGQPIPIKNGYRTISNNGSFSLFWDMKPNSFDVDNDKSYYIYNVLVVDIMYRPMYGFFVTANGSQTGQTDPKIMMKDKLYLIKTSYGFKIFKRIQYALGRFYVPNYDENGAIKAKTDSDYKWIKLDSQKKDNYETFDEDSKTFIPFSSSDDADYFISQEFNSDLKYETFHIFDSVEQISSVHGVKFFSQKSLSDGRGIQKVFFGPKKILEASEYSGVNVYGLYSNTKLSYADIMAKITDNVLFYSSFARLPSIILDDSDYSIDKVKMYIAGKPDKMSVNIDMVPDSEEEGKKTFIFMLLYDKK